MYNVFAYIKWFLYKKRWDSKMFHFIYLLISNKNQLGRKWRFCSAEHDWECEVDNELLQIMKIYFLLYIFSALDTINPSQLHLLLICHCVASSFCLIIIEKANNHHPSLYPATIHNRQPYNNSSTIVHELRI